MNAERKGFNIANLRITPLFFYSARKRRIKFYKKPSRVWYVLKTVIRALRRSIYAVKPFHIAVPVYESTSTTSYAFLPVKSHVLYYPVYFRGGFTFSLFASSPFKYRDKVGF